MRLFFASLLSLLALSPVAYASDYKPSSNRADLAVYVGQFSALRSPQYESTEIGLEYRFRDQWYGLRPTVGGMTNTDGAIYGYAGINWDLPIKAIEPFVITPGVKIGGYSQGDSKDLGYGIEFRDSLEITYRFQDGQRLGGAISHMSNASLGSKNPGVEMLEIVYSHPL